jgi:hypothetical protein
MDSIENRNALEAYIASLSDEERERHKKLIEECKERDAQISRDYERAMNSFQVLDGLQSKMMGMLKDLEGASERLLKIHAELYLRLLDRNTMHS